MKIIDLSHELIPSLVDDVSDLSNVDLRSILIHHFKPDPSVDWHIASLFSTSSHIGTHLESPYHWTKEGVDISSLPLESLIGPAMTLDFSRKNKGEAITRDDVKESSRGRFRKGDIIFLQTGHNKLWGTEAYWFDSPYLTFEAAEWFVSKEVKMVGIDGPRLDCYRAQGRERYVVHEILHGNGVLVIENMTNLDQVKGRGTAFILPLRIRGIDAFPVRAILVEEGE